MVKCIKCLKEISIKPINEWEFRFYHVSRYRCNNCGAYFNTYAAPGKKTWTVPKSKKT